MNVNTAYLVARVSDRSQEAGYSLSSQERLLMEYASRNNLQVVKLFKLSETASKANERKVFEQIFKDLHKNKIFNLVFEKVDRSTRSFKWLVKFYDWFESDERRKLHLVYDNIILHKNSRSQDKLNYDMKVVWAKNYSDNLSEEVKKGHREKIRQMKYPGPVKFGYESIDNINKEYIPHPKLSKKITKCFKLYSTGKSSIADICIESFKFGLKTKEGNKLSSSRMHNILKDPFYYGYFRWNGKIYCGTHVPLISKDLYLKVQNILKRRTYSRYMKHNYLLQGKVVCGECGYTISWYQKKGHIYGKCSHFKECNQTINAREDRVEEEIKMQLRKLDSKNIKLTKWIKSVLNDEKTNELLSLQETKKGLNERLKKIDDMLSVAYQDKLNGEAEIKIYNSTTTRLNAEKEIIKEKLNGISEELKGLSDKKFSIAGLKGKNDLIYGSAGLEDKRKIISIAFSKISFKDGKGKYYLNN
ncbi:recombinase family protein [Candidatus Dojkabacteria bacterium]|uniref:Recombinase family protein n=1 Tax=Candidatus Dojkabacteria bacterium TaxID=2099670 RepID=A0A955I9C6_9BACT|nr:recombinase family protein [Candidatus Dojkabacteria bacterium]